jgi:hypothetical protein
MRTVILSESQIRNVIDKILSEQNSIKTEALAVNFDAIWPMGKWKLTSQQSGPIIQKLTQITDFINKNQGGDVTIQIEAGESQVTNRDGEDSAKPVLDPGVLSQRRGESMVTFLTQYFQGLVSKGAIQKMPTLPNPITKIGKTPYKKGSNDLKDKQSQYQQEQFVRAIVSIKKDYECLVGMEITIGYYPGQNKSDHTCDEAIFDLRMNGISLGEVNLNNSRLDVSLGNAEKNNQQRNKTYQNRVKKAELLWDRDVKDGTIKISNNPQKAEEQKANYIKDYSGEPPTLVQPPSWLGPLAAKNGYKTINEYEAAIIKVNQSFAQYGRKSDGQSGGARSQTFILDGAKAESIINNSPSNKIVLSIVPLVGPDSKYKIFHTKGSHADTPWVTIKSKKSQAPLFNGEPNAGMKRGSTAETILLQTDLCGVPLTKTP